MNCIEYYAQFSPALEYDGDTRYNVNFPDIKGCFTCGKNIEDAFIQARDILNMIIPMLLKEDGKLPIPSDYFKAQELGIYQTHELGLKVTNGTFYALIRAGEF